MLTTVKTKLEKEKILRELTKNVAEQTSMVFLDYKGVKVKPLLEARKQAKIAGGKLLVAKKTLAQKAFQEKGIEINVKDLPGQLAVLFSFGDPVAGVKAASAFAKANEMVKVLGGYFEKKSLTSQEVLALSTIPSRAELLSMLLRTMQGPITGLVTVLQGNIKGLVVTLNAIQKAKTSIN